MIYRKEILRVYELLSHNNVNQVTYRAIADKYIEESEKVKNEILELSTNKDQINTIDTVDASVVDLFDASEQKEEKIIKTKSLTKDIRDLEREVADLCRRA